MLSSKANKQKLTRFGLTLGSALALFFFSLAPHAQMNQVSPDGIHQLKSPARQERQTTSIHQIKEKGTDRGDVRIKHTDGERSLEVRVRGELEFTDDDSDIESIARDGYLMIEERRGNMSRRLEVVPGADAQPHRTFYVGGRETALDREGREWLARVLPDVIRNTAIGVRSRVGRIHRRSGASGVLDEISLIKSDGAKRIYFRELLAIAHTDTETLRRAMRQAGREISSDGEKAGLLIETASLYLGNRGAAPAFFETVSSISSDGERRLVLSSVLKRGPGTEDIQRALRSARAISSDGEKAGLLTERASVFLNNPAVIPLYFDVINSISSDGERALVLTSLLKRQALGKENLMRVIRSAELISSDGEKANVLIAAIRVYARDAEALTAIAHATKTVSSDGEKERVLSAIARLGRQQ